MLDALAGISVSRLKSQVVAISLQLDPNSREIHLTIAENSDVADGLVSHLTHIWELLRLLSSEYVDWRGDDLSDWDYHEASPDIPHGVADYLKVQIFQGVYKYALAKQMHRVGKWWDGLGHLMKELAKRRGEDSLTDALW